MMSKPFMQSGMFANVLRSGLVLAGWILATQSVASAQASEPRSGTYGPLALVVAGERVHGVFSEGRMGNGTSEAPQFSCLFLLEGRLDGHEAAVETWFPGEPERISGTLRLGDDPGLQLSDNHGGCLMASGDMVKKPFPLLADAQHADWIGVGLVIAEKVVLQANPKVEPKKSRPFIVGFDSVAILERRPGWMRVMYIGGGDKPASGWVPDAAVAASPGAPR